MVARNELLNDLPSIPSDLVPRKALWNKLECALAYPLTLVIAPGGYGKTTTVVSWLHQSSAAATVDVAWCSLERVDNNLHCFCAHLVKAVQKIQPGGCALTAQMLNGLIPLTPDTLASQFVQDLAELSQPLVLIIDDYHVISEPAAHGFLEKVLGRIPQTVSLMLLSRRRLPLPVSRLRSQQLLLEIRLEDLLLNSAESAQLLGGMLQVELTPRAAELAYQRLHGWGAGLRLLALSLRGHTDIERYLADLRRNPNHYLTDYFMDEVLANQTPAMESFLLRTSILSVLTPDLCAVVLDSQPRKVTEMLLEQVVADNLFVIPMSEHSATYRYHDLFQSMLQTRLYAVSPPEEMSAAYRRVADFYAACGDVKRAIDAYLLAGAPEAACDLIEAHVAVLQNSEQWQQLNTYLLLLPTERVEQRPALLLAQAWLQAFYFQLGRQRETVAKVGKLLEEPTCQQPPARLARLRAEQELLAVDHEIFLATLADLPEVERRVRAALELLPVECQHVRGIAWLYLARHFQRCGQFREAADQIEQELQRADPAQSTYIARLYQAISVIHALEGKVAQLPFWLREHLEVAEQACLPATAVWARQISLAYLFNQVDWDEEVIRMCHAVLRQPYASPVHALLVMAYALLLILEQRQQHSQTLQILSDLRGVFSVIGSPETKAYLYFLEVVAFIWSGNVQAALPWLMQYDICRSGPTTPILGLTWGYGMLAVRTPDSLAAGCAGMRHLIDIYMRHNVKLWLGETRVLWARMYAALEEWGEALPLLSSALLESAQSGMWRYFLVPDPMLNRMLEILQNDPVAGDAAKQALRLRQRRADVQSAPMQHRCEEKISVQPTAASLPPPHASETMGDASLTERELQILSLLPKNLTKQEIASRLHLSPHTVDKYVRNIYAKLDVHTRLGAVMQAQALGYLRAEV